MTDTISTPTDTDFASLVAMWEATEHSVPRLLGVEDTETVDEDDNQEPDWEAMWEYAVTWRARRWSF